MTVKYRNIKTKPLVLLLFSLLTLVIMCLSASLARHITDFEYEGLIYTAALACAAIPIHILGKRNELFYIASWALNSVGIGLAMSSYYFHIKAVLRIGTVLIAVGLSAVLITLLCLLLYKLPQAKKAIITVFAIILALLTVASVVFWIIDGNAVFSLAFFCLIEAIVWLFVCRLTVNVPKRHILRDVSFGGFGIAITVGVVVLAIITEDGSGLEFLDGAEILGTNEKKRGKTK